jgi:hypothetical protein
MGKKDQNATTHAGISSDGPQMPGTNQDQIESVTK